MKMKTESCLGILLFLIAVTNAKSQGSRQDSWHLVIAEDLTIELINLTDEQEDSSSTWEEWHSDVLFNLYTVKNPDTPQLLYPYDVDSLANSNFDPRVPTRIVIHGWLNSNESKINPLLRAGYLESGFEYNFIFVDWNAYAKRDYWYARSKVQTVGEYVGEMIDFLVDQGMDIKDLIILGHSLGAHVSGIAGRSCSYEVPIIVAMDPASPLFWPIKTKTNLSKNDARVVYAIHTNAGFLGYPEEIGHIDMWPNGGSHQRGCVADLIGSCAHSRSYVYFSESLRSKKKFTAKACENYSKYEKGECENGATSYLGGLVLDTGASGSFYLKTSGGPDTFMLE
ncbi:pancreatic triacylglycerol lipase-like [Athalia rosae]|uniref:pancreatic triacylglycerol lipase-like n=1 Tax=Athalia rosae TaxID=37344 RepID=UPI0020341293|nr:pancreatic triacylglycerol lipase-like [Athalia rosae]